MKKHANFGALPGRYSGLGDSAAVILPVPYDRTSTWIKGADRGPEALIEASANMEFYDIETESEPCIRGIYTDAPVECRCGPEEMAARVRKRLAALLDMEKFVVIAGGEHSVSIGAIEEHAARNKNLSVLQLDAHSDLREEWEGSAFNHACVMARAREKCKIVQVGIRSMDIDERKNADERNIFFAHDIHGSSSWYGRAVSRLGKEVYVTIDLDVFDPSIMPSTGTPEPGGLGWYQVLAFLMEVFSKRNVVGLDVVELCPNSSNKAPDFLAAKLIYKLLAYKYKFNPVRRA